MDPAATVPVVHRSKLGLRCLHALRALVLVIVLLHLGVTALSIVVAVASWRSGCHGSILVGTGLVGAAAGVRVAWVIGTGLCQAATAVTMISEDQTSASQITEVGPAATMTRAKRRLWYKRWLWWGRFGALVTSLQVAGACYLSYLALRNARSSFCAHDSHTEALLQNILVILPVATWILAVGQCCVGSDVLSWRSLYEMQNEAWRAHYREIFDHGIRELLCCLGRSRYMSTMDNDEVDSVAGLLGDLVAYRAAGASHLEFLAGVALLRTRRPKSPLAIDFPPAPEPLIREAAFLHAYAVAAYTGPLLDIGRTLFFFPCAWIYRQGLLTLWNRHRMPSLDGDNWWRGHATAFLRAARLPAEALLKGRVHQRNRETVYFVIELREIRCLLVAVRGTETPEDLLTDGLGRECVLSQSDIKGLLMSRNLSDNAKQEIASSTPHYGHAGVVAAARELAYELDSPEDNLEEDGSQKSVGFLHSVLGPGGRCEGFRLRFAGHSLGGSIAAVTGMLLCHRFPDLHVYGYGVLPCVDAVLAEACSGFVTSIVYNDEFSSRLSVASLMRLRAAALRALAVDSDTDSAVIAKLARRLFGSKSRSRTVASSNSNHNSLSDESYARNRRRRFEHKLTGGVFLCYHACHCVLEMPKDSAKVVTTPVVSGDAVVYHHGSVSEDGRNDKRVVSEVPLAVAGVASDVSCLAAGTEHSASSSNGLQNAEEAVSLMGSEEAEMGSNDNSSRNVDKLLPNGILENEEAEHGMIGFGPGEDLQQLWPVELVMPGLVIHIVRCSRHRLSSGVSSLAIWKNRRDSSAGSQQPTQQQQHRAIMRDRDSFRDIVVSPSMFLDHMPWRCQRALNDVVAQFPESQAEASAAVV